MTLGAAGMDPLSEHFTLDAFASLAARHASLTASAFLLNHDVFTRISPDLADQILAQCQIAPQRPVGGLSRPELHRFYHAIRDVMGRTLEGHHGYGS